MKFWLRSALVALALCGGVAMPPVWGASVEQAIRLIRQADARPGEPQRSREVYLRALALARGAGNVAVQIDALTRLGIVSTELGELQQARTYYEQAVALARRSGNREKLAIVLVDLARLYDSLGQHRQALALYQQALPLVRRTGERALAAEVSDDIGQAYMALRQPEQALAPFDEALALGRALKDRDRQAVTLINLAEAHALLGRMPQAQRYYSAALPLLGNRYQEAITLNSLGLLSLKLNQPAQALDYFSKALARSRASGDRPTEAIVLGNLGIAHEAAGRNTEAIGALEQALQLTLRLRSGLARDDRSPFLRQSEAMVAGLIELLIAEKQVGRAYTWANLITTSGLADFSRLVGARVGDPAAQTALDQWNATSRKLDGLRASLRNNFSPLTLRQLQTQEGQLNREAQQIARRFPQIADLFETTVADVEGLLTHIPAGTVVLHPVVLRREDSDEGTLCLFTLTSRGVRVHTRTIEPDRLDTLITDHYRQLQDPLADGFTRTGGELFDLLVRPVLPDFAAPTVEQVSVIATGKLRYVPFETLYDRNQDQYLLQRWPVSNLTNLSTRSWRSRPATSSGRMLALGNPVPEAPRNLPGAAEEVVQISRVLPGSEVLLGKQATLENFKNQMLSFPYLHLATHGCFQAEGCPELGMAANTLLFSDRPLNIADAALLGLQNTELVTLSACQTALDHGSDGREVAGLAYLFERAGARAVIATLWAVEDNAAKELMVDFYRSLGTGVSKAEALRQAKLSRIDRHPFYWAPFILIGDAR